MRDPEHAALLTSLMMVSVLYFGQSYYSLQSFLPIIAQPMLYFGLRLFGLLTGLYFVLRVYINGRMIIIFDRWMERSERPVVISLQGDHGPGSYLDWESLENSCLRERVPILNAYYFPTEAAREVLYPAISPVNPLRAVLNGVLGQPAEYLEDRSYSSTWSHTFDVVYVTDLRDSCTVVD